MMSDNAIVDILGWKGKSGIEITTGGEFYIIREWRKTKEDHTVVVQDTRVPVSIVQNFRKLLRANCPVGKKFKYREIVELIKKDFGLTTDTDAWNGGRNRKQYFELQYYPTKILENEGFISYDGRGNVVRLR